MYIYWYNTQTVNKEGYDSQDYNVQIRSMYTLLRTTMYRYMVFIYITYVIYIQCEGVNKGGHDSRDYSVQT